MDVVAVESGKCVQWILGIKEDSTKNWISGY